MFNEQLANVLIGCSIAILMAKVKQGVKMMATNNYIDVALGCGCACGLVQRLELWCERGLHCDPAPNFFHSMR